MTRVKRWLLCLVATVVMMCVSLAIMWIAPSANIASASEEDPPSDVVAFPVGTSSDGLELPTAKDGLVYTGQDISEPLILPANADEYLEIAYYKVTGEQKVQVTAPKDAGEYEAVIAIKSTATEVSWAVATTNNQVTIPFTVAKKTITVATGKTEYAYTGSPITFITDNNNYKVTSGNSVQTEVGKYEVVIQLLDSDNTQFENTSESFLTLTYTINQYIAISLMWLIILLSAVLLLELVLGVFLVKESKKKYHIQDANSTKTYMVAPALLAVVYSVPTYQVVIVVALSVLIVLVAVVNLVRIIKNKHLYVAYQKEHIAQPQQTALATASNTQQKALVPTDNTVYNTATLRQDFITYVPPVQVAEEQPEEEQQAEQLAEQQEQPQEEPQEQQEQLADTQQEEQPMKEEKEDKAVLVAEQPQEEKPKKAPAKKATTKKATTTKKAEPKDKEAKEVTEAKAQEEKPKKTTTKKATTSTTTAKKATTKKAETANAESKKATTTKAEPKKSTATTKKAKQPAPDPEEIKEIIKEVKTKSRKEVTAKEVNTLLPDVVAKAMVQNESTGKKYYHKDIINVDTLSANFESGATVNLESLKQKGLIANNVDAVKVLARGTLTKKLTVELQDFSIEAVKMILLTGGEAHKV